MKSSIAAIKNITFFILIIAALISCHSMQAGENRVVNFLNGAELQIETADQRDELKRALKDILSLRPEQLRDKRYANYRMEAGVWTLPKILTAYYFSPKPMMIDAGQFYTDVTSDEAKSVVRKNLQKLEKLDL